MVAMDEVVKMRETLNDFLDRSYFLRLRAYSSYLDLLNSASKLYQTQKFPVGCFVPLVTAHLIEAFQPSRMDQSFLVDFKRSILRSLEKRMKPSLTAPNNFLMAALLHPGVCSALISSGGITKAVADAGFEELARQVEHLDKGAARFVTAALEYYRENLPLAEAPSMDIPRLSQEGTFNSVNQRIGSWNVFVGWHLQPRSLGSLAEQLPEPASRRGT